MFECNVMYVELLSSGLVFSISGRIKCMFCDYWVCYAVYVKVHLWLLGLHALSQLCNADLPENIKRYVARAVKLFIGDAHLGVDLKNSQVRMCCCSIGVGQ